MPDFVKAKPIMLLKYNKTTKRIKPKTLSSKTIYRDTHIQVRHDVLKAGFFSWNQVYLEWHNKNAVCIVPYENNGVFLIRQYRHAASQYLWQFPGGLMESDISEDTMVRKELLEETGFVASKLKKIGTISPEPGLTTANVFIYIATRLRKKKTQIERSEIGMELKFFPIAKLKKMIQQGKINCGITLSAYLLFDLYKTSRVIL